MLSQIVFLGLCACFFMNVHCISLDKLNEINVSSESSEEKQKKEILESLKEFVNFVDKYNLNVSIIGSQKKYGSSGLVKEDLSITIHMPVNDKHLTKATLDDDKQDKYLTKLKKLAKKEHIGGKTRVIKIENGEDTVAHSHEVNEIYLINSPGYKWLTSFKNGVQGFWFPENETNEILYNYVIKNPNDTVKHVQVITAQVIINELEVSEDFPVEVLQEIKEVLPKLWLSIDDDVLLARLLVQHLDKKFDGNHQVLIGVENFALSGKKFVNLEVGDSNVLVFTI